MQLVREAWYLCGKISGGAAAAAATAVAGVVAPQCAAASNVLHRLPAPRSQQLGVPAGSAGQGSTRAVLSQRQGAERRGQPACASSTAAAGSCATGAKLAQPCVLAAAAVLCTRGAHVSGSTRQRSPRLLNTAPCCYTSMANQLWALAQQRSGCCRARRLARCMHGAACMAQHGQAGLLIIHTSTGERVAWHAPWNNTQSSGNTQLRASRMAVALGGNLPQHVPACRSAEHRRSTLTHCARKC